MTRPANRDTPNRYLSRADVIDHQLVHAVWELTLACNLKCKHCGSRAGDKRTAELTTQECLDLVGQLSDMGTREVTLIGGEAYMRADWIEIVRAISDAGMQCTMQTGAWQLTDRRIAEAADAGLVACGVSVDGNAELHDYLRGRPGSYHAAMRALSALREYGIRTSVNTQITAAVMPHLRDLLEELVAVGVRNWQVQLTVAMGRAADRPSLLLQPYQMNELMPLLAELYNLGVPRGLLLQPGNNIGYFGPHEALLRGSGNTEMHWSGCFAGRSALGIEADGTIKGCPSLPTASYAGGNVRDTPLSEIWSTTAELGFTRTGRADELWGFCGSCYYADVCEGGCSWTTHSLLGRRGNNPYCHYRASELKKQGLRERIECLLPAPGTSFDHGRFAILLEGDPDVDGAALAAEDYHPPQRPMHSGTPLHVPALVTCRSCNCYVYAGTASCPHCAGDMATSERDYQEALAYGLSAAKRLTELLNANSADGTAVNCDASDAAEH